MPPSTRLLKELKEAQETSKTDPDIQLTVADETQLLKWVAVLRGPRDTPYEGTEYNVTITVPRDYPMVPPVASFVTKVFHPNIHFHTGEICLDILKTAWSPAWTLTAVCRAIHSLLSHPDASSPLNCDAGNMIRIGDFVAYHTTARYYAIEARASQLAT